MSQDHGPKLKFSVAVSRNNDAAKAGVEISGAVRRGLDREPADLAFLFFSPHYVEMAEDLAAAVRADLAPRVLLGCTGEGVIAESEEIEGDAAVALWAARLPDAPVSPIRLSFTQEEEGFTVSGWPDLLTEGSEHPTFLLLAEPFSTPVDDVLSSMADRYPGSLAIGGLAGGGHDVGQNRVLLNDEVHDSGLVGVAVSGPVSVRTLVSQGCRPIGERFVVTRAEKNVIHELGGSPALARLETVFKSLSSAERRMAHRALHVGIVMDEQRNRFERGDFLIRNLVGADRTSGSVAIGDMVREGQTVQFHIRDAGSASEDLNLLLTAERSKGPRPTRGALLFSCCGRGRGLFGRPHHDVMTVRERMGDIPIAGFFAQGEIGPVGGSNFLHGYTASVALFSEPGS
ncbi:MAG: FIST signal transduction protein [Nitrospiraceae bacterium]